MLTPRGAEQRIYSSTELYCTLNSNVFKMKQLDGYAMYKYGPNP